MQQPRSLTQKPCRAMPGHHHSGGLFYRVPSGSRPAIHTTLFQGARYSRPVSACKRPHWPAACNRRWLSPNGRLWPAQIAVAASLRRRRCCRRRQRDCMMVRLLNSSARVISGAAADGAARGLSFRKPASSPLLSQQARRNTGTRSSSGSGCRNARDSGRTTPAEPGIGTNVAADLQTT